MARFYTVSLQATLFGECALVREWGRIGRSGQVRETRHTTEAEAQGFVAQILHQKVRKGYKIT